MIEQSTARAPGELEIGGLQVSERDEALGVMVRGMSYNPVHLAVFGEDPVPRERRLRRLFGAAFAAMRWEENMLVARGDDGIIVGVCGALPPGGCQLKPQQMVRLVPALTMIGPRAVGRTMGWLNAWAGHDPQERHWHLGPVAVDAPVQGMGVGSTLLRVFCARMDAAGEDAYLETDKDINVRFYEKFGFRVVGEQSVLGTPNWFMTRRARER